MEEHAQFCPSVNRGCESCRELPGRTELLDLAECSLAVDQRGSKNHDPRKRKARRPEPSVPSANSSLPWPISSRSAPSALLKPWTYEKHTVSDSVSCGRRNATSVPKRAKSIATRAFSLCAPQDSHLENIRFPSTITPAPSALSYEKIPRSRSGGVLRQFSFSLRAKLGSRSAPRG